MMMIPRLPNGHLVFVGMTGPRKHTIQTPNFRRYDWKTGDDDDGGDDDDDDDDDDDLL